jgi:microsomal dipeptidase-like Zn-dependent dipeptidase
VAAEALHKAGFSQDMIEDIFWRNAYDFWHATFAIAGKVT